MTQETQLAISRFRRWLIVLALLQSLSVSALPEPQLQVDVERRDSIASVVSYNWIDTVTQELEAKLQLLSSNPQLEPEATKTLEQDEALIARLFRPKWREASGMTAFSSDGRDVLLGRFNRDPAFPEIRSLVVWDDPDFAFFMFETDPNVVTSPEQIRRFWKDVFLIPNETLDMLRVEFKLLRTPALGTIGAGWVVYAGGPASIVPGSDPRGYAFYLGSYRNNNHTYMCVLTGKRLFQSLFEPDMLFVPERFPPLRERLKVVPNSSLIERLNGPFAQAHIVAQELVSRKLTTQEVDSILKVSEQKLPERLSLVLSAIAETHREAQYRTEIEAMVSKYGKGVNYDPSLLEIILTAMRGAADLDLSSTALALIADGKAVPKSIVYLEFRGQTKETAEELQKLKVSENLENLKNIAVREILRRTQKKSEPQ